MASACDGGTNDRIEKRSNDDGRMARKRRVKKRKKEMNGRRERVKLSDRTDTTIIHSALALRSVCACVCSCVCGSDCLASQHRKEYFHCVNMYATKNIHNKY